MAEKKESSKTDYFPILIIIIVVIAVVAILNSDFKGTTGNTVAKTKYGGNETPHGALRYVATGGPGDGLDIIPNNS